MKKFRNALLLFALTFINYASPFAQSPRDGSEVIGRWDLTVTIEDKELKELGLFRHGLMQ